MASKAKTIDRGGSRQSDNEVEAPARLLHTGLEQEIRGRAYEIYLERGVQPGHELEDWLQAERESR